MRVLVAILLSLIILGLSVDSLISRGFLYYLDYEMYNFMKMLINPTIELSMINIIRSFDHYFIWGIPVLLFLILLLKKDWWNIAALFLGIGGGTILISHLKRFFHQWTPMVQIIAGRGYIFPSGHSFYAMLVFGFMIYLAGEFIKTNWLKYLILLLCTFSIFLIGISLVSLNKHWFSEVLGGYCAGFSWLLITILMIKIIKFFWESERIMLST